MKIVLRSILSCALFFMLIAICIRLAYGSLNMPTFSTFLETLSGVPAIEIPFLSPALSGALGGDWGLFEFLRLFLLSLSQIIDVLLFIVNGILSVTTYIVYFFRWLFVF